MKFKAQKVSCTSAIGGEILQVLFSEKDDEKDDTRYVLISRMFEFPGRAGSEWLDQAHSVSENIKSVRLRRNRMTMTIDNVANFQIEYDIDRDNYRELSTFISSIFDSDQIIEIEIPS
jgi:hypothetical protein